MADPSALLAALRQEFVRQLARTRTALERDGILGRLGPAGAEWDGTPVAGRLLAPLDTLTVSDELAALILRTLGGLVGGGGPVAASLRGWDPDPTGHGGQPRGLAYALRTENTAGALTVAVALTGDADDARLTLVVGGAQDVAGAGIPLVGGWRLALAGRAGATFEASIGIDGTPAISGTSGGDFLRADFARPSRGPQGRIGVPGGPGVDPGAVSFGGELRFAADGSHAPRGWARIADGSVDFVPGPLASVVPTLKSIPLDVGLALDPRTGVSFEQSSALDIRLPVAGSYPGGVTIDALDLSLHVDTSPSKLAVGVGVTTSVRVTLPGLPVELRFDGHGITLPFAFDGSAAPLGFDPAGILPVSPTGAGLKLNLPVIRGTGRLVGRPRGEYAGVLAVALPPMSATAFGVLGLPDADRPLSLLAVIGASFPPPGIQIGFGFAVSAIGGVVGINRRIDRDALMGAVTDGSAANLLFPGDPAGAGDAVIAQLPRIFPPQRGAVVAGPMLQISWGGRLVAASLAVLVESSDRVRVSILGKLVIALPDPEAPLILIQVTFAGQVDPGVPSVEFVASLTGSHIAFVPLSGDLYVLSRGGRDPAFILSAGGFHPAFAVPQGVPELRRIGMDLSPSPVIDLRCEAYFAVTTNTIQFGARLELVAEVAGCGLRGHLSLDVLVQRHPHPYFVADISARIAVEVFGETLAGIGFDLRLEGPTPWRARGRGSIDLFLFSASFDFDKQWGPQPPLPERAEDVGLRLHEALASPQAWTVQRPGTRAGTLALTVEAEAALGHGERVDPHASLVARQLVVPLAVTIRRFNSVPVPEQTWDIAAVKLGPERPALPGGDEIREPFARGQFLDLSDDEQLSRPAFEPFRAGVHVSATGTVMAEARGTDIDFETSVITDEEEVVPFLLEAPPLSLGLELVTFANDVSHPFWRQPLAERVEVAGRVPVTLASAWSMQDAGAGIAATATEALQTLAAEDVTALGVIEAWELVG